MRIDVYVREVDEAMFKRAQEEAKRRRMSLSKLIADLVERWLTLEVGGNCGEAQESGGIEVRFVDSDFDAGRKDKTRGS